MAKNNNVNAICWISALPENTRQTSMLQNMITIRGPTKPRMTQSAVATIFDRIEERTRYSPPSKSLSTRGSLASGQSFQPAQMFSEN